MGQAGAWTSEIFFDDVRVPSASLVGGEEEVGFKAAMASLNKGRLHIGAICVGQATRILDETIEHAKNAQQGGRPIADFQLVQAMLADMYADLQSRPCARARLRAALGRGNRPQARAVVLQARRIGDARPRR